MEVTRNPSVHWPELGCSRGRRHQPQPPQGQDKEDGQTWGAPCKGSPPSSRAETVPAMDGGLRRCSGGLLTPAERSATLPREWPVFVQTFISRSGAGNE